MQKNVESHFLRQKELLFIAFVQSMTKMAMAMDVGTRLWLGGVVGVHRNRELILSLAQKVRSCAKHWNLLRVLAPVGRSKKWVERTPAMAAGLTDHRWTMKELLSCKVVEKHKTKIVHG